MATAGTIEIHISNRQEVVVTWRRSSNTSTQGEDYEGGEGNNQKTLTRPEIAIMQP